jgi:hypothetical protein
VTQAKLEGMGPPGPRPIGSGDIALRDAKAFSPSTRTTRSAWAVPKRWEVNLAAAVAGVLATAIGTAAYPHHSYAMFDRSKDVVLVGTVKSWQWTNPHTWMVLLVPTPGGAPAEWDLEGQSTAVLHMLGWNREMVKPGDKVTVHINPLKTGARGGQIAGVTGADGHVYGRPAFPK